MGVALIALQFADFPAFGPLDRVPAAFRPDGPAEGLALAPVEVVALVGEAEVRDELDLRAAREPPGAELCQGLPQRSQAAAWQDGAHSDHQRGRSS